MSKAVGSSNHTIKLIMLNGPLSGQIFNFKRGRKVQIGRIVRGNVVTIKDDGVSSKHLLIEYQFLQGHWMISDLDSKNGTFLNGCLLDPYKAAQISNGDMIEIGEATSISVEIEVNEEESVMVNKKPPRRSGRNSACEDKKVVIELEETDEDLDGIVDGEEIGKLVEIEVNEQESMMVNEKPPRRRGRNSACKDKKVVIDLEDTDEDMGGIVDGEEMRKSVEIEVNEEYMMVNEKPPRRRARNSGCKEKNVDIELEETDEDLDGIVDGEEMVKSSTAKDAQARFHSLRSAYSATPTNLKVIDLYIVFAISTALMQLVYVAVVGSFPFNSFLSGMLSCVGTAVLAVCLRMQVNKENKEFKDLPAERAFADFVLSNLVLHLVIVNFLG